MARRAASPGAPRRLLALTCAAVFLDTVFFAAITPLLPQYVEQLGLSKGAAGGLIAAYPAGTLLMAVPAIWVVGRIGVKRTLLIGLALLGIASLAFGLAESTPALAGSRFAQGISAALSWAGGLSWLVSQTPVARRGETIGLAIGAALAGALIGPALGGAAAESSTTLVFGSVAAITLVLLLVTLVTPAPGEPSRARLGQIPTVLRDNRVRLGLWIVALDGLCLGAIDTLAPLQLDAAGLTGAAIAGTFIAAVAIETALAPIAGRLSDRWGPLGPVRLALPLAIPALALLGWPTEALALIALIVLCSIALGPLWTPGTVLLADGAEARGVEQVVTFSLSNATWSIGGVIGAGTSGLLGEFGGDPLPYTLLAALCAITLLVCWRGATARAGTGAAL